MIFDQQNLFSNAQSVLASAVSTNVIDLGATGTVQGEGGPIKRDIGPGTPIPLRVQVVEAFNNATSLQVELQVSATENFAAPVVVGSQTKLLADLAAGSVFGGLYYVPRGTNLRYVRLNYTLVGTAPTTGKVTAGIVAGHQENNL